MVIASVLTRRECGLEPCRGFGAESVSCRLPSQLRRLKDPDDVIWDHLEATCMPSLYPYVHRLVREEEEIEAQRSKERCIPDTQLYALRDGEFRVRFALSQSSSSRRSFTTIVVESSQGTLCIIKKGFTSRPVYSPRVNGNTRTSVDHGS